MPSAGLRKRVEAIPGTPAPHGILTGCTEIVDVPDVHELLGTEWMPLSCIDAHDWDWCPDGDESPGGPVVKDFARPGVCSAAPITIYAGVTCSTIGWQYTEAVRQAREALRMGEQRALEEWFMRDVLCPMADDLTPAEGAVSIAQGIATLEGWLASTYGGRGVLHVPAGAAALLGCCNVVALQDGTPRTLMGNCVIMGAGYSVNVGPPDCSQAPSGEAWLYVTGPLRVRREAPEVVPDTDAASVRISTNDRFVLAERSFVVEVACCEAAGIRVTLC
ncbi:cupin [Streptomyces sp. TRM43335]|uniref:Cupin n=1 Tax=Streptomyces taklimakanensis TaxID=2569853 RepID=A0A6G2BDC5_9ACTN|nr:cupin [Streptomyces taklimakanensis]